MRAEIGQVFIERAWERLTMAIAEARLCYGVNFKQTHNSDDKWGMQAEYQAFIQ